MTGRIYLYPGLGEGVRHYFASVGTSQDIERLSLELVEGLKVNFYDFDGTDKRADDKLLFEGTIHFDSSKSQWYALIDWNSFRHESDENPIKAFIPNSAKKSNK